MNSLVQMKSKRTATLSSTIRDELDIDQLLECEFAGFVKVKGT